MRVCFVQTDQLANWPIGQPTNQPLGQPNGQPNGQPTNHLMFDMLDGFFNCFHVACPYVVLTVGSYDQQQSHHHQTAMSRICVVDMATNQMAVLTPKQLHQKQDWQNIHIDKQDNTLVCVNYTTNQTFKAKLRPTGHMCIKSSPDDNQTACSGDDWSEFSDDDFEKYVTEFEQECVGGCRLRGLGTQPQRGTRSTTPRIRSV